MDKPQIVIFNAVTSETITRDMNQTELTEYEANQAQTKKDTAAKLKAEKTIADERQIILDRLGITNDELQTILL